MSSKSKQRVKKPRIILFDIETIPDIDEVMKAYVGLSNWPGRTLKASLNAILCFGWKELDSPKVNCINAWDFPGWQKDIIRNDDRSVAKEALKILSSADAIVTQNGKKFDQPFLQTRLEKHELGILPKIAHIDTKKLMSKNLFLFSNSLDYSAQFLGEGQKLDHEGWPLWYKCWKRDSVAMKLMEKYCKKDVELTERMYKRLRKYSKDIPNHNLFWDDQDDTLCPSCGSVNWKKNGPRPQKTGIFQQYVCKNCGTPFQKKISAHKTEVKPA